MMRNKHLREGDLEGGKWSQKSQITIKGRFTHPTKAELSNQVPQKPSKRRTTRSSLLQQVILAQLPEVVPHLVVDNLEATRPSLRTQMKK